MSFTGWYHLCPKHEGEESAVFAGETCSACGLNESAYRLTRYSDDQLRAECERRWRGAVEMFWPALAAIGGCKVCGAPPGASCTKECDDDRVSNEAVRLWSQRESGPGIAKRDMRPDNGVAWLDEDLLCEDVP